MWEREESGREYMGTLGRLGRWRYPPEVAVRTEPSGILKRAGGRDAGSYRWEMEGRKLSRTKTDEQPESHMAGSEDRREDRAEIKRVGGGDEAGGSSSFVSSRHAKGFGSSKKRGGEEPVRVGDMLGPVRVWICPSDTWALTALLLLTGDGELDFIGGELQLSALKVLGRGGVGLT